MNLFIILIKLYLMGAMAALIFGHLTAQFIATKKLKKPFFWKFFKQRKKTRATMFLVALTSWVGAYHACKLFIKESNNV